MPTRKLTFGTVLVDADVVLHRAAAKCERAVHWGGGWWSWYADEEEAWAVVLDEHRRIEERFPGAEVIHCLSGTDNFRKRVAASYKSNRTERKPMVLKALRQRLVDEDALQYMMQDDLEADDVMGLAATGEPHESGQCIILSVDKDLDQIPGYHSRSTLEGADIYKVTPEQADRFFWQQVLSGDNTDGIPGCPSVGPKTAVTLTKSYAEGDMTDEDMWDLVVTTYERKGLHARDAIETARLVRILRDGEYSEEGGPVLWEPPKL